MDVVFFGQLNWLNWLLKFLLEFLFARVIFSTLIFKPGKKKSYHLYRKRNHTETSLVFENEWQRRGKLSLEAIETLPWLLFSKPTYRRTNAPIKTNPDSALHNFDLRICSSSNSTKTQVRCNPIQSLNKNKRSSYMNLKSSSWSAACFLDINVWTSHLCLAPIIAWLSPLKTWRVWCVVKTKSCAPSVRTPGQSLSHMCAFVSEFFHFSGAFKMSRKLARI